MSRLTGRLPDWAATQEPPHRLEYGSLLEVAEEVVAWPAHQRRAEVASYSAAFCFPDFDLSRASGLYVLLRVVFALPAALPREEARVFGGWLHPSIGSGEAPFDLSWPVRVDEEAGRITVEPFTGYRGKGYDGTGEFDWFDDRFPYRAQVVITRLRPA